MKAHSTQFWCWFHQSPANEGSDRCWYDFLLGPRPGRGPCDITTTHITAEREEPPQQEDTA